MSVSDWSTNPDSNSTINGIDISEGCAPANINNAIRNIMADVRVFYDGVPVASDFVAKNNGVFSNQPRVEARGGLLFHNSSANASGRIFTQNQGQPAPSMSNGDILLELAPA